MATRPGFIWSGTEWVSIGQEAVVAPVAYQASAPSTPATGDIWIDSDDDVPSVNSTLYYRWKKTMSGGETSVSGTDDNSLTLAYTAGYESVFINGVLQVRGSDYTATTGTSVTGMTALTAGDIVMVESVVAYSVGDTYTQSQMTSLLSGKSDVSSTGMVLVATATIGTAVSSVTVSNCFSSAYENYKIVLSGGSASTLVEMGMRLNSTTTGYYSSLIYGSYAGSSGIVANSNGSSFTYVGNASSNGLSSMIEINCPYLTQKTTISARASSTTTDSQYITGGFLNDNTSYASFTLFPVSGTITGGTIKVYGYK